MNKRYLTKIADVLKETTDFTDDTISKILIFITGIKTQINITQKQATRQQK